MLRIALLPAAALISLLAPVAAGAQDLAGRVAAAPAGEVRLHYAPRPGVCAWDRESVGHAQVRTPGDLERRGGPAVCPEGLVRVALTVQGGEVTGMRTRVGGEWPGGREGVTDLGRVGAPAAAEYLLSLAESSGSGRIGSNAVYSAVLADSTRVEPALARIARVDGVPRGTRSTALFWLAQQASNASAAPGQGGGDDAQRAEQEQAVYSLVRLPRGQGIPELVRVAREHPDPRIRRSAIFWLGSTGDPRAVDLFEELLRR